jgi:NAD(P)-dependent dehydrogenase (short-subunit alcohol dehydrogenase family)
MALQTEGQPADVEFGLKDRVIIVTGASSGIGRWLAQGLSQAGAQLILMARRAERVQALSDCLPGAIAVPGDVSVDEDRGRIIETALTRCGRIDGLVNNAGTANFVRAIDETADDVRRLLDVNVVGPFDLARRCAEHMRASGGGSIVNITSMSAIVATGLTVPSAGYCASKAALAHMTRELAVQWGRYSIRVNAVAPGMYPTEMVDGRQDMPEFFASRLALRRVGCAEDILGAVQFLLSDASTYITGQQLAVDGGRTIT